MPESTALVIVGGKRSLIKSRLYANSLLHHKGTTNKHTNQPKPNNTGQFTNFANI